MKFTGSVSSYEKKIIHIHQIRPYLCPSRFKYLYCCVPTTSVLRVGSQFSQMALLVSSHLTVCLHFNIFTLKPAKSQFYSHTSHTDWIRTFISKISSPLYFTRIFLSLLRLPHAVFSFISMGKTINSTDQKLTFKPRLVQKSRFCFFFKPRRYKSTFTN